MRTTFVFDTVIYRVENEYYTRTLIYNLWKERYIPHFGSMTIMTRVQDVNKDFIEKNEMLQKVNGDNVKVKPVESYKKVPDVFFKRKKIINEMINEIEESDFVIIRTPAVLSNIAAKICLDREIPFLNEMVADPWNGYYYHSNIAGKLIAPYMYFKTKNTCKKSNNIIYVTKQYLQNRYPSGGENIIGLSDVIIPFRDSVILTKRLEKIKKIEKSQKLKIGIIGNYDLRTKGQDLVIDILPSMNKKIVIELIGAGDKTFLKSKALKNKVGDQVHFIGTKKSGDDIFEWMDSIDLLVVPSFQEGLPRVVVEAMSRGLPVIGSDVGGIPELIDKSCIFKKGDRNDLEKKVKSLLTSPHNLKKQAEKNFDRAKNFEYESIKK
ncbi:MAG: glycosyltransferase, partial [Enterococcus hulanensis]